MAGGGLPQQRRELRPVLKIWHNASLLQYFYRIATFLSLLQSRSVVF
jgi:hypothetical protein